MNAPKYPTYLVGTRAQYSRYLREHGLPPENGVTVHVTQVAQLTGAHSGDVIFLKDFEVLKEWRAIYNYVIARRTQRLREMDAGAAAEYRELHWGTRVPSGGTQ